MTKILLVEDDKSLREIYGVRLLAEGYDIVSAGDGEEALAMAIKERPDLILSDVMMPKISGFDMLDILRSTTETKDIKVIIMTALSSEDQRMRGESLGADMYLVKSQVGIEDVVRSVKEVLARPPMVSEPQPLPTTPQPAPAPIAPQPAPQPMPLPQSQTAPQQTQQPSAPAPQPAAPQAPTTPSNPTSGSLPQPTAPFSTPREKPNPTSERVIQPPVRPESEKYDVAKAMAEILSSSERDRSVVQPNQADLPTAKEENSPQAPYQTTPVAQPTPVVPQPAPQPIQLPPTPVAQPVPTPQPPAFIQQPVAPTPQAAPQPPQTPQF